MAMQNPYNQYKENSIKTASPEELTLMLYNGAIKFINQGKLFIEQKNISKANDSIIRAQDIIFELNMTLDMEYEVSKHLSTMYSYITEKLLSANIKKDSSQLDQALEVTTSLRDTWKEAMRLAKSEKR